MKQCDEAARREEDRQRQWGDIVTVPFCNHCKRRFHTEETCWDLHSQLKPSSSPKRKNERGEHRSAKKPRESTEEQGQGDNAHIATALSVGLDWREPNVSLVAHSGHGYSAQKGPLSNKWNHGYSYGTKGWGT